MGVFQNLTELLQREAESKGYHCKVVNVKDYDPDDKLSTEVCTFVLDGVPP